MGIQEAVPVDSSPHLTLLFSIEVLGRLPSFGHDRVRRTMLVLLGKAVLRISQWLVLLLFNFFLPVTGTYATWFTTQSIETTSTTHESLLMNAIKYVVAALPEPSLWFPAANALRDICDSNRSELAPHIGAFAELHAGLTDVPVSVPVVFNRS